MMWHIKLNRYLNQVTLHLVLSVAIERLLAIDISLCLCNLLVHDIINISAYIVSTCMVFVLSTVLLKDNVTLARLSQIATCMLDTLCFMYFSRALSFIVHKTLDRQISLEY